VGWRVAHTKSRLRLGRDFSSDSASGLSKYKLSPCFNRCCRRLQPEFKLKPRKTARIPRLLDRNSPLPPAGFQHAEVVAASMAVLPQQKFHSDLGLVFRGFCVGEWRTGSPSRVGFEEGNDGVVFVKTGRICEAAKLDRLLAAFNGSEKSRTLVAAQTWSREISSHACGGESGGGNLRSVVGSGDPPLHLWFFCRTCTMAADSILSARAT